MVEVKETRAALAVSLEMLVLSWPRMDMRGDGKPVSSCRTFKSGVWSVTPRLVRNIYFEPSKADDVQFILDLIAKIGAEIPEADMNNVNIAGKISM